MWLRGGTEASVFAMMETLSQRVQSWFDDPATPDLDIPSAQTAHAFSDPKTATGLSQRASGDSILTHEGGDQLDIM